MFEFSFEYFGFGASLVIVCYLVGLSIGIIIRVLRDFGNHA